MKIVDKNDIELKNPDFKRGYLKEDVQVVHHNAVKGVKEQSHYKTVKEYPNGGKDVRKIIDVPGVEEKEAWEEKVPVYRYIEYTEAELAELEKEKNKPKVEQRLERLEKLIESLCAAVGVSYE